MKGKLSEAPKGERSAPIFRDSLIGNVRDCVDILSRLNVTGDADLDAVRERVSEDLATLDVQALRSSEASRAAAVRKADAILSEMTSIYGGAQ